jgi:hypothetical protein
MRELGFGGCRSSLIRMCFSRIPQSFPMLDESFFRQLMSDHWDTVHAMNAVPVCIRVKEFSSVNALNSTPIDRRFS